MIGALLAAAGLLCARPVQLADLSPEARKLLGAADSEFPALIQSLNRRTAERLRAGEYDHLIYYLLQSRRFTSRPAIEPALSAREYAGSGKIPEAVRARIADFLAALRRPASGERLAYFRTLAPDPPVLEKEYARAMNFLYRKEFGARAEGLYQERGHSTDTQVEANFAVHLGLAVLKSLRPAARMNRVLIVGPGLDFAPRTGLADAFPPQSYQPFAVADALLQLGLADPRELSVHCVDINPRVVRYLDTFAAGPRTLYLLPGLGDTGEFRDYFRGLGQKIGSQTPFPEHRGKKLQVTLEIAGRISAECLNIVTERPDCPAAYDLAVASNVFLYFDRQELLLALANLGALIRPGGWLLHNEPRPEVEEFARSLGLPPLQARSVRVGAGRVRPLFDTVVLHEKFQKWNP